MVLEEVELLARLADIPGLKTRYVMKTAKDSYTSVAEYAGADGKWITTSTGKSARTK